MKFITPNDGWGRDGDQPRVPREWQARALPKIIEHFSQPNPRRAIIRAVMASGKSILMSQILASIELAPNEVIVVSTSTIGLVEQLSETFRQRLESMRSMHMRWRVGSYYTHSKDLSAPLVVTCVPSMPDLAKILETQGRHCVFWLPDEAHRQSEAETIKVAYDYLRPDRVCGFTATPYLAKEGQSLSLFDQLITDYSAADAIRDGVVVPWRIIPWDGGEEELDIACIKMTKDAQGPGLFNATSVADAEIFSQKLCDAGMEAMSVHSKLPRPEIKKRIDMLRDGHLAAIVHVSMLQEGVDWPWLRWLCLRRPVSSRVRFVQEVGRVLRAFTDKVTGEVKTEAILYDPHDLFGEMRLTYEAVLGGDYLIDTPAEEKESERIDRELRQQVFDMMKNITEAKAGKAPLSMQPLASYLREVVTAFDVCGLIERKIVSRSWRHLGASDNQGRTITNMKTWSSKQSIPNMHQRALGILCDMGKQMTRGMASDLISILMAIADKKKWPDFKQLDRSASENTEKHETKMKGSPPPAAILPDEVEPSKKDTDFPLEEFMDQEFETEPKYQPRALEPQPLAEDGWQEM